MDKQQQKELNENKKQQQQIGQLEKCKRRGTVKLEDSKGPPESFYLPSHSILTIGDGDLSFSTSIAQWLQYKYHTNACKFIATTYDSLEQLQTLYKFNVRSNIKKLENNKVQVYHKVDVNQLNRQETVNLLDPQKKGFDRIVWNFPHAGFPQKSYGPGFEWQQGFHEKHIKVIDLFFSYSNIYLKQDGLILMAHKTVPPFSLWNIPGIAEKNKYKLEECGPFNIDDYPGYENRRGAGKNGAKRFPIEDAVQYVFKKGM